MILVHNRKTDQPEFIEESNFIKKNYLNMNDNINYWVDRATQLKDYKYVRKELQRIGATYGFDNFRILEQKTLSRWFAVSKEDRNKVLTLEEQIDAGFIFNLNSIKARSIRFGKAVSEIYNRLTWEEANEIINDVENYQLKDTYINYGREGLINGDTEGLFDYIMSSENTTWETIGLSKKGYDTEGLDSMQELSEKIMIILNDGNY